LTFVVAWVGFPIVLAAVGAGWGRLVEWASGGPIAGALVVPVGLAAAIVVGALATTNATTAGLAVFVVAIPAVVGLASLGRAGLASRGRAGLRWAAAGWPALAAIGVLLVYGAPVLATGTTTLTGFVKLDDSATWLGITAHLFAAGRSTAGLGPSGYKVILDLNLGSGAYPVGSFILLGIGRAVTGVDAAWVYQPYLACCGAALGLCVYALTADVVASRWLRGLIAFVGAQPALLYGYSLIGGVKELTAAFLLALVAALAAPLLGRRPAGRRRVIPLGIAASALIVTFGPGSAVWVVPALGGVCGAWVVGGRLQRERLTGVAGSAGLLAGCVVVLALPVWIVLGRAVGTVSGFTGGASQAIRLGILDAPLSAYQIAGIWPDGDFRDTLHHGLVAVPLIGLVLVAGAAAVWATARARAAGPGLYVGLGLLGCAAIGVAGGVPWVAAKGLAVGSPAVVAAGLIGGAMLWQGGRGLGGGRERGRGGGRGGGRERWAGGAIIGLIGVGVVWSNVLGYHDATLAPVGQFSDLAQIGRLVSRKGPTLIDDDAVYADHYFLRAGDPVEPDDLRSVVLRLRTGAILGDPALPDLDSFAPATILPYRSIVTRRSPAESRPPSVYGLTWVGRYYELWQRPADPTAKILEHVPFGDSGTTPYCGVAQASATDPVTGPLHAVCSIQPVGTATCRAVRSIAAYATRHDGTIVADERPANVYARGTQLTRPASWLTDPEAESIAPRVPGTASVDIRVTAPVTYELWLGGSFGRGFVVSVDGRRVGRVSNELSILNAFVPVSRLALKAGVHTIALTYPPSGLAPGSGDELRSVVTSVVLAPVADAAGRLVRVVPRRAGELCGKSVDWIEVVGPVRA
jgi:hypothetical protein